MSFLNHHNAHGVARATKFFAAFLFVSALCNAAQADALMDAVRSNDTNKALQFIKSKSDVNQKMSDGTTPLHWAVYNGNQELVKRLLKAGAKVNVSNDYGSSPMSEAGVVADADILQLLIKAGGDVESPTLEGQTVLMSVARTDRVDAAKLLIKKDAAVNAVEEWRGQTALMWAAAQSQPEMIKILLEAGASPNARSKLENWERQVTAEPRPQRRPPGGFTPLLFAAREGCAPCARELVRGGADINLADPTDITPLVMATLNARWDVAKVLIEEGADVNRWDMWGRTPLYSAVDYNTTPRGGRPDRPSLDQTTAIDVVAMLLQKGANPNAQLKLFPPYRSLGSDRGGDSMLDIGTTPLIRAAKAGDIDSVKLLLEHGALPNLQNVRGHRPMTAAAGVGSTNIDIRAKFLHENSNIEVAKLLLAVGADINATTDTGTTALHGAAQRGWEKFAQFAIDNGANINAKDNSGFTPLDTAMGRSSGGFGRSRDSGEVQQNIVALLQALGAEYSKENSSN